MKRLFATAVFVVALALLLLATARAAVADDVEIKSVAQLRREQPIIHAFDSPRRPPVAPRSNTAH